MVWKDSTELLKRGVTTNEQLKRGFRLTTKQAPIDKTKYQWSDLVPNVLAVFNNKNKHRITGMTPAEAKKLSSEADANMAMKMVAMRGRKYPILQIQDIVRILKKRKKEFMDQFER